MRVGPIHVHTAKINAFARTPRQPDLSDRTGRRPVNVWGTFAFLLLIYPVFVWIADTRSDVALVTGVIVLTVTAAFGSGAFIAALAEGLPKSIRGSGFATVYSVAIAAFGGTTQLIVTWLIHITGSAMAPAWYMIAATAAGLIALMLMRETAPVRIARAPLLARAVAAG